MISGKTAAALIGLLALALPLSAQHSRPDVIQAVPAKSPVRLDGVLDEPDWAAAPRISNFSQRELNENQPATERTEVAVLFSKTELRLGVMVLQTEKTDAARSLNFSIVRYKQDLGEQSSIGLLAFGAAQAGSFALLRPQPVRRHPRPASEFASE
ncbi:MAG: hypothetical protein PHI34_00575 [Acidobacteriota bacterium]|nr:hypothetical protein [Acidobacteriota bacterium]